MSFLEKITARPWEHAGEMDGVHGEYKTLQSASRTGLMMFLAVISSMFLLFMITYYTRSQFPDWEMLDDPRILWANTGVLILASIALQMASNASKQAMISRMRNMLIIGGLLTLVFVAGQWVAWEQLVAAGYYAAENPANAFFYLFTGLHALHLVGGLFFVLVLGYRLKQKDNEQKVQQGVSLCATYWHYLLLVWLALFTLLLRT
jgi:cytochrome c oxidase subunit 3